MSYTSVAIWPADADLHLSDSSNETRDTHPTFEHAAAVCRLLRERGFGGDGVIFPVSTHVEDSEGKRISGALVAPAGARFSSEDGYYPPQNARTGEEDAEPLSHMTRTYKVENTAADDPGATATDWSLNWDKLLHRGRRTKHGGRNPGAFGGRRREARLSSPGTGGFARMGGYNTFTR